MAFEGEILEFLNNNNYKSEYFNGMLPFRIEYPIEILSIALNCVGFAELKMRSDSNWMHFVDNFMLILCFIEGFGWELLLFYLSHGC